MRRITIALALSVASLASGRRVSFRTKVNATEATVAKASKCPVESCKGGAESFLQIPSLPMPISIESETPCKIGPSPPTYDLKFKPGHFTCMHCDVGTCEDCSVMCDLSQCIGQFYTQECWCRTKDAKEAHPSIWQYRDADSNNLIHGSVQKYFCDDDCTGGICDQGNLQCGKREDVCQPWWYCDEAPSEGKPAEPVAAVQVDAEPHQFSSFLSREEKIATVSSSTEAEANAGSHRVEAQRLGGGAIDNAMRQDSFVDNAGAKSSNDFSKLNFEPSRFVCESASLPPKVWDPEQMMFGERGYIVFDKNACSGSPYRKVCFCWDNFKYLRGEDAMTSELKCDDSCGWGACEGKTCALKPPPPLPEQFRREPALDPAEAIPAPRDENMAGE